MTNYKYYYATQYMQPRYSGEGRRQYIHAFKTRAERDVYVDYTRNAYTITASAAKSEMRSALRKWAKSEYGTIGGLTYNGFKYDDILHTIKCANAMELIDLYETHVLD